jgi:hypothetical protein
MADVNLRCRVQPCRRQVMRRPDARRADGEFARIGFAIGDQLLDIVRGKRRLREQYEWGRCDHCNRREIVGYVEGHSLVQPLGYNRTGVHEQERVSITSRFRNETGTNDGPGAGPILYDDRLMKGPAYEGGYCEVVDSHLFPVAGLLERIGRPVDSWLIKMLSDQHHAHR